LLCEGWRSDQQETDDDASHAYPASRAYANFGEEAGMKLMRKFGSSGGEIKFDVFSPGGGIGAGRSLGEIGGRP
jgi:hypothetical protein